ncbi:MAG: hypothetical protein ACKVS6_11590 [Planctomycetota bacterium]
MTTICFLFVVCVGLAAGSCASREMEPAANFPTLEQQHSWMPLFLENAIVKNPFSTKATKESAENKLVIILNNMSIRGRWEFVDEVVFDGKEWRAQSGSHFRPWYYYFGDGGKLNSSFRAPGAGEIPYASYDGEFEINGELLRMRFPTAGVSDWQEFQSFRIDNNILMLGYDHFYQRWQRVQ